MADIIDIASQREQEILDEALYQQALRARQSNDPFDDAFNGVHCLECEDIVSPVGRIELGYTRCLHCQEDYDKRMLLRRLNLV